MMMPAVGVLDNDEARPVRKFCVQDNTVISTTESEPQETASRSGTHAQTDVRAGGRMRSKAGGRRLKRSCANETHADGTPAPRNPALQHEAREPAVSQ